MDFSTNFRIDEETNKGRVVKIVLTHTKSYGTDIVYTVRGRGGEKEYRGVDLKRGPEEHLHTSRDQLDALIDGLQAKWARELVTESGVWAMGHRIYGAAELRDAILAVVPEPPAPTNFHNLRVSIENDYVVAKFTCTAPEGSLCRLECPEMCEMVPCGHHEPIDGGTCHAKEWCEAVDWLEIHATGHESLLYNGPVNAFWDGEDFQWQIDDARAAAPEPPTLENESE